MDPKRYWDILRCADSGKNPDEIQPPLTKGEKKWLEESKAHIKEIQKTNPKACYVPHKDPDFTQHILEFNPDEEYK